MTEEPITPDTTGLVLEGLAAALDAPGVVDGADAPTPGVVAWGDAVAMAAFSARFQSHCARFNTISASSSAAVPGSSWVHV